MRQLNKYNGIEWSGLYILERPLKSITLINRNIIQIESKINNLEERNYLAIFFLLSTKVS